MRLLIAGVLSVIVLIFLIVPSLKKYKGYILTAYAVVFMLLIAMQTFRTAGLMLPFYHAKEQLFYQKEFAEEGMYPDAMIQLIVKNKTVYVKDDLDEYVAENFQDGDFLKDNKYWLYAKYHQKNMTEFLEANGALVFADDSLNNNYIDDATINDFSYAGNGNDMFRSMFMLSNVEDEWSNNFYYYWYYCFRFKNMDVFINADGIVDADEIVLLWDDKENETTYIMTKDYYDREVANNG